MDNDDHSGEMIRSRSKMEPLSCAHHMTRTRKIQLLLLFLLLLAWSPNTMLAFGTFTIFLTLAVTQSTTTLQRRPAFCPTHLFRIFNMGATTWPAIVELLAEWAANRLMGSTITMQRQVKANTVASYLSALRSWHVDDEFSLTPFEAPRLKLLHPGGRSIFPSTKALRVKRSKTDVNHSRVLIMLAATNQPNCPVTALRKLFIQDPQAAHAPLLLTTMLLSAGTML